MSTEALLDLTREVVADLYIIARSISHTDYPQGTNVGLDFIRNKLEKRLLEISPDTPEASSTLGLWASLNDLLTDLKAFSPTGNVNYDKKAFAKLLENFQNKIASRPYYSQTNAGKLHEIIRELKQ